MSEALRKRNLLLGTKVVKSLEERNMEAYYVESKEEALKKALTLIPEGSSVSWGGSESATVIGLLDAVHEGEYTVLDRDQTNSPEERNKVIREAFSSDYYITSSNAVSEDGILVNMDGSANRVAAIAYGPANVLMIIGMNKVVKTEADAVSRTRNIAAPINAQRFSIKTPCSKTGSCSDCKSADCICCQMLTTRFSKIPKRIKVILVGEELGF